MRNLILVIFVTTLLLSCKKESEISSQFQCASNAIKQLEEVKDMKNLFTVSFPKNWKTNLYYDNSQSSIYTADTTKQLTKTTILDVTFISKSINFTDEFKLKHEQDNLQQNLIQTNAVSTKMLHKDAFYSVVKGVKNKYPYQACNLYIKVNDQNFILAKTEIYGDSLVNERLCNAIYLIEQIQLH